jgi:hypothetical protein
MAGYPRHHRQPHAHHRHEPLRDPDTLSGTSRRRSDGGKIAALLESDTSTAPSSSQRLPAALIISN